MMSLNLIRRFVTETHSELVAKYHNIGYFNTYLYWSVYDVAVTVSSRRRPPPRSRSWMLFNGNDGIKQTVVDVERLPRSAAGGVS